MGILKVANVHFDVDGTNRLEFTSVGTSNVARFVLTGGVRIPVGATTQRPANELGIIRYNNVTNNYEGYFSSGWANLSSTSSFQGGALSATSFDVTPGPTNITGTTTITGATTVSGNFQATSLGVGQSASGTSGAIRATTITTSGSASFGGTSVSSLSVSGSTTLSGGLSVSSGSTSVGSLSASSGSITSLGIGQSASGVSGELRATTLTTSGLSASGSGQINSLGVGTGASGTPGEIRATNNITAYYSDKRLKENIAKITNALSKLKSISGVFFNANKKAEDFGYKDKTTQVGVLAQEIEAVLPEAVALAPFDSKMTDEGKFESISGENYLTVRYERIIPLLIEAIKEQQETIEKLQENVKTLLEKK